MKDARDAVRNVVFDDVAHEKHRQPDADDGKNEVEPVGRTRRKFGCEQRLDEVDEAVENKGRDRGEEANQQRKDDHELLFGDAGRPFQQPFLSPSRRSGTTGG